MGVRWQIDEYYIEVKGRQKHYYREVDTQANTFNFLLTAKLDKKNALNF